MRRLPVYLLLDTSGSMRGEAIEAVKNGLRVMVGVLRQDPQALESVHLCVISFDRDVEVLLPLTPLEDFQTPDLDVESGPTHLGLALQELVGMVDRDIIKTTESAKGDWRPLLFVMTDGSPSDKALYQAMIPEVRSRNFGVIVVCGAGPKAKEEDLKPLADELVMLDTMDSGTFEQFFKWVSASISSGNASMGTRSHIDLPDPPSDVHQVVV